MSITTDEVFMVTDERPITTAERDACTPVILEPLMMCNDRSPEGNRSCVLPQGHSGVHMCTRSNFTVHLASWGNAAQWGISPTVTETSTETVTETATEDATTAFIRAKLSEPVAVNITDFGHYTASESREQYNYARRQLLELADKYRSFEDAVADERNQLQRQHDMYMRAAAEHQSDFETFANMLLAEAERRGWCSDYERFADEVNGVMKRNEVPHRMKEYVVTNTYTVTVSVTVTARDEDGAIEEAQSLYSDPRFSATGAWDVIDTTDDSEWNAEIND